MNLFTYKSCACGADHTLAEWLALPLVGRQRFPGEPAIELRNCQCGSTIAIELPMRPVVELLAEQAKADAEYCGGRCEQCKARAS